VGEVADLLLKGVQSVNPELHCVVIHDELAALSAAMDSVASGGLVAVFPEKVEAVIHLIQSRQPAVHAPR
jgi:hypothetical protein